MGCCGSSAVDDEEHLDYSAGKVTIIPDLRCWELKLNEASELGQTELVTQFDVRATPTFIFMRDKKEIDKLVGGNQEDLQKKFDPYCQQN
nr:unnamed protein product [Digitaria exilis]